MDQVFIGLTGVIALWLVNDKRDEYRRWGPVFGMLGQPFWFYATWKAQQWGIFVLCGLYTLSWAKGLWTHWQHLLLRPARV